MVLAQLDSQCIAFGMICIINIHKLCIMFITIHDTLNFKIPYALYVTQYSRQCQAVLIVNSLEFSHIILVCILHMSKQKQYLKT